MRERAGIFINPNGPSEIALDGPFSTQIASRKSLKYLGRKYMDLPIK
jgi:hypothetical protein